MKEERPIQSEISYQLYQAMFEHATLGILAVDKEGLIRQVNEFAEQLFGYSSGQLNRQKLEILIPDKLKKKHVSHRENFHKNPVPREMASNFLELYGQRKDGSKFPVKISLNYVEVNQERLAIAYVSDDSLQKNYALQLEKQVEERTQKLQESEAKLKTALTKEQELGELKSRFVSMASHEFRTPLSAILGSAELLNMYPREDQQEKREKHTRRIIHAVTNLTNILNDFLSLEKLESGKLRLEIKTVNLSEFMNELLEEMVLIAKPNQSVQLHFTGNKDAHLDPYLLKNICLNLLSNALKYSSKDVDLIVDNQPDKLFIQVKDYGIGIPEVDKPHMFTRFFRANNATNIKGTGLGLTIVKRYLDLIGGRIWFESKEGQGTVFFVEIGSW